MALTTYLAYGAPEYSQDGTLLYRETDDGPINYIYLGKKLIAKDGFVADKSADQHFYPYGSSVEGEVDDIGYTGHKFDKDLDLVYMQARYYDPMIGRFYSNDPVDALEHLDGEGGIHGFNRFTYANNNPYKYIDPDGRETRLTHQEDMDVRKLGEGEITRDEFESRQQDRAEISEAALTLSGGAGLGLKVTKALVKPGNISQTVENVSTAVQVATVIAGVSGSPSNDADKPGSLGSGRGAKTKAELRVNTRKTKASILKSLGNKDAN